MVCLILEHDLSLSISSLPFHFPQPFPSPSLPSFPSFPSLSSPPLPSSLCSFYLFFPLFPLSSRFECEEWLNKIFFAFKRSHCIACLMFEFLNFKFQSSLNEICAFPMCFILLDFLFNKDGEKYF